jgi:hypothetical protein
MRCFLSLIAETLIAGWTSWEAIGGGGRRTGLPSSSLASKVEGSCGISSVVWRPKSRAAGALVSHRRRHVGPSGGCNDGCELGPDGGIESDVVLSDGCVGGWRLGSDDGLRVELGPSDGRDDSW